MVVLFLVSHTDFHSGWTNLHSHQQSIVVPFSLHPCQHLFLFVFLMITTLTRVRQNFLVFLICISFVAKGVTRFFMYLLAICTFSFENCPNLFAHLLIDLFFGV
jgi:hypothetical protein